MKKQKEKKKKNSIKPLLSYFKKYRLRLIVLGIIIFLSNMFYVLTGYLNGSAIEAITNNDLKYSLICLGVYLVLSLIAELFSRCAYMSSSKIQIIVARKIGYDVYGKVMKLPAYAFEELSAGEIINRVTGDTSTIVGSFDTLLSIISNIIASIIILVYIFMNTWIIGVEIIAFLLIYGFVSKFYTKKIKENHQKVKEENDKYSSITNETIRGIREVKTLGIIDNLKENVKDIIRSLYNYSIKEYKVDRNFDLFAVALRIFLEVGAIATCAVLTYQKTVSLTFFIAMTYYIYRYMWLIENVTHFSKTYEHLSVAVSRISEILNNVLYDDVTYGEKCLERVNGVIEFKNVSFNYKNEKRIFDKFNITFEPNKKIAIVGASGGGKSTLFNLITRLFEPISGNIYLDGVNINDLTEETLRKHISIIRQEPFIFNRSIMDNFRLIDDKVNLKTVRKYCKMAYIDDYIMSLPKKYNTILGEGGVNLSGGQKQRLAIARTLLKESKIILFDEATSALDNESQKYIKESIDGLSKDHTVIIIAHRLSTIIDADIIYVIKDGRVYDKGNHQYLIKNCDYYKNLYTNES